MGRKIILVNDREVELPFTYSILFIIAILSLVVFFSIMIDADYISLFNRFDQITSVFHDMFIFPDFSLDTLKEIYTPMVETVQMSIAGTIIGCILALPAAILASTNINKNKSIVLVMRFILSITRTMPVLVYALILTYIFDLGSFAGTIAIIIFTFSIVSKMLFEYIETLPLDSFEAMEAGGLSKSKAVILGLIPEVKPSYISMSLYTFEINIRSAAVLGMVGAGGIGQLIEDSMSLRKYSEVGTIIIVILAIVVTIELISRGIRRGLS